MGLLEPQQALPAAGGVLSELALVEERKLSLCRLPQSGWTNSLLLAGVCAGALDDFLALLLCVLLGRTGGRTNHTGRISVDILSQ